MNDIDVDQPVRVTPEPATARRSWPPPGTSSARPGPWSMVSESLQTSAEPDDPPPSDPPEPVVPAGDGLPGGLGTTLVSSGWDFTGQCQALKASKAIWR